MGGWGRGNPNLVRILKTIQNNGRSLRGWDFFPTTREVGLQFFTHRKRCKHCSMMKPLADKNAMGYQGVVARLRGPGREGVY